MTTEKLIAEYQSRVTECDKAIEGLTASIKKARGEKEDESVIGIFNI